MVNHQYFFLYFTICEASLQKSPDVKIAKVIGILHKLKRIFPRHILRLIYNSLIHPHLLYCLNLWGFKYKRITVLQKKAVRIIAFRHYISHSTSAFKKMQILLLKDLYLIQLYKIYYKIVNNIYQLIFKDLRLFTMTTLIITMT